MLRKIMMLFSLVVLASCVGTLEDTTKKTTDATILKPINLSFTGITKGVAVAHNKVQLYFKPASGGSNNYSYLVYQDGNLSNPVASIAQSELTLDKNGEYSLSVTNGLELGTSYTFLVRAFDPQYNVQDSNNVQVIVQTLAYKTPIFSGIQSLLNVPGKEGETALIIGWNAAIPATTGGGGFGGNLDTISGYNIYVGDSEDTMAFYSSLNDPTAISFKLSGLEAGKLYYVRVRAKNSQTTPVEDLNQAFLTRKTLSQLPVLFGGVTAVSIPATTAGFSTVNVKWVSGSGNYDRYKIFARKDAVSSFNPGSNDYLMATITDLSVVQTSITVTEAHTNWYVAVVACSDSACTQSQGQNVIKFVKTSPPVASFNGIKTLTPPTGGEGLSQLDITWDLPDSNTGVYDEIRVFKSDAAGNFNQYLDRVDNVNYNSTYPSVIGIGLRGSTFLQVKGLPTGVQACFVALAYSTSPMDVANPDGRTGVTRIVKCATPQYSIPGFNGIKLACTNRTAKSFKISWDIPNPRGTYEDFEIYYKSSASGFVMADAIAGAAGYQKVNELPDATSHTLTNLLMNSTYQILVKTHFFNPVNGLHYRDNNSIIATCSTGAPTIEQGPWFELFAIGPKFDGLNGLPISEKLTPLTGGIDGKSGASIGRPEWKHQYPVETLGADLGISESRNGIIRIAWEDMVLSDDLGKLHDFNNIPNTGYKVYRVPHSSLFGTTGPALNDNSWGDPINTGYIQAPSSNIPVYFRNSSTPQSKSIAQYVDYSLVHPYNSSMDRANEATVYWYKVEPWYNGKKLSFSSISSDAAVKMVLPPKNMAFVHRWMSNKQICEDAGLPISRSNNYKCEYNGLGASEDIKDSHYYYDMKGDLLVDRFELSCNFSRGLTTYQCSNTGGFTGYEGVTSEISTGVIAGDCIGRSSQSPDTRITAKLGAVFYNRQTHECFVNTSQTGNGTAWKSLSTLSGYSSGSLSYSDTSASTSKPVNKGLTTIPPTFGPNSNTIPVTYNKTIYAQFSRGEGFGAKLASNNANLPALFGGSVDQVSLSYVCQSSHITVNGSSFLKRLARKKEFIVFAAESPLLSPTERNALDYGSAQATYDNSLVPPVKNYFTMPLSEHNDRDCNVIDTANGYYNPLDGRGYNDAALTSYNGTVYSNAKIKRNMLGGTFPNPGTTLDFFDPRYAHGGGGGAYAMMTGGSAGPLSTEACSSRYGVQDTSGNVAEWASDLMYCDLTYGCSMGFKDKEKTIPYTPPIDPEVKDNWLNPNGVYFSVTDVASAGASTISMGAKLIGKHSTYSSNSIFLTDFFCWDYNNGTTAMTGGSCSGSYTNTYPSAKYFSVALGIPLECGGDTCIFSGTNDSNTLVTTRANPPSATTLVTSYNGAGNLSGLTNIAPVAFVPMANGGNARGGYGRYAVQFSDLFYLMNQTTGGRCNVLLPENY